MRVILKIDAVHIETPSRKVQFSPFNPLHVFGRVPTARPQLSLSSFTLVLDMSKEYNPLPVTQQPKPAMMDATIKSEEARCCHGHVAFVNTATGHPKSHNSCFQRLIFPTALAAFVLLAGLFALSLSRGYLNLSDLELDNLLPRATSSSSGSPFVKNKRE